VPVFAIMIGFLGNMFQINTLSATLNGRFTSMETRISNLETSFNARFDTLIGKVIEIDNRLTRVEERLDRR